MGVDFRKIFEKIWDWILSEKLLVFTVLGVVTGIWLGFVMNLAEFDALQRYYWAFLGDVVMMNMLKSIIVPLITLSITTGVASLAGNSGKLSLYAVLYYLTTTIVAIVLGIVMSYIVKPGSGVADKVDFDLVADKNFKKQSITNGLLDIIRNCFPPNVVSAMFQTSSTSQALDETTGEFLPKMLPVEWTLAPRQNVLGLITFFGVFGYLLGKLAHQGNKGAQDALRMMNGLNDAVMELVDLIMWFVPIGLVFLISNKIMSVGSNGAIWASLGWLIFTSIMAILIHAFIFIPLIYWLATRKNPFVYMAGVAQAVLTAFSNASSAATMPITLRNLETHNHIDKKVTRFMIPLGATINMDGTALYEAVAALFIAQINNISLNFGQVIVIAITATAASIGAAAVPSAGLITLVMVLSAVGLPLEDISLIFMVDWFLDRFRTACNVWGDCVGCGVVYHFCEDDLHKTKEADYDVQESE